MLQNLLFISTLLMIFTVIQLSHPLTMGLLLLIQTLLTSLLISFMNETYWFSYILFLTFMGGMLVLFIYVTSLASNEMFSFSTNYLMILSIIFFISLSMLIIYDPMIFNEMFYKNMNINKENTNSLIKLFSYPTNLITILLMNYLLITLVASVKITNIFYGPLRQMFN